MWKILPRNKKRGGIHRSHKEIPSINLTAGPGQEVCQKKKDKPRSTRSEREREGPDCVFNLGKRGPRMRKSGGTCQEGKGTLKGISVLIWEKERKDGVSPEGEDQSCVLR